jgi:preprotein translocase subunit SecG
MVILFLIAVVIFVVVCIGLCLLVLIQNDKGGGISGAIGGGLAGANTLLGAQDTANILTRGTTIFAITYMVLCIILSLGLTRMAVTTEEESVLKKRAETESFSPASVLEGGGLPIEEGSAEDAPVQGLPLPSSEEAPSLDQVLPLEEGATEGAKLPEE